VEAGPDYDPPVFLAESLEPAEPAEELEEPEDEELSDDVLDLASDPAELLLPDSLLMAFFRESDG
jgi:hypothetical protein